MTSAGKCNRINLDRLVLRQITIKNLTEKKSSIKVLIIVTGLIGKQQLSA